MLRKVLAGQPLRNEETRLGMGEKFTLTSAFDLGELIDCHPFLESFGLERVHRMWNSKPPHFAAGLVIVLQTWPQRRSAWVV